MEVRSPPPQKGYLSDTCAIPYENKAKGCDTPSAMLSRKGIARYGGVSRSGPLRMTVTSGILLELFFRECLRDSIQCDMQLSKAFQTFRGATGPSQLDLPPSPDPLQTPPPRPDLDPILTWFGPDSDPKSPFSGQKQVKSDPNRVREEVGGGPGPAGMALHLGKVLIVVM